MADKIDDPILPVVKCVCPRCEVEHVMRIYWTGKSKKIRKFCPNCKNIANRFSVDKIDIFSDTSVEDWRII